MMPLQLMVTWILLRVAEARRESRARPDRGDIVQTVIIVGLFAAAAIIIVGILVAKATSTANKVKTE
jgi:hypothetical protein